MALRTQIVQYVTVGVRNAVRRTHLTPPKKSAFVDIFSGNFSSKKDKAVVPGLEVLEFLLDGKSVCLSSFLFIYLSIYLSICRSMYLSICRSIYHSNFSFSNVLRCCLFMPQLTVVHRNLFLTLLSTISPFSSPLSFYPIPVSHPVLSISTIFLSLSTPSCPSLSLSLSLSHQVSILSKPLPPVCSRS